MRKASGLTPLGRKVGIWTGPPRPTPAWTNGFGFDMAGNPFDTQPFRGDPVNDAVYPLPDIIYRRFVKSRAVLVLGDGTIYTFREAIRHIDPTAAAFDQRDMTIRVVTSRRTFLELADENRRIAPHGGRYDTICRPWQVWV